MKNGIYATIAAAMTVSGCGATPLTEEGLNWMVTERYWTDQCIRKGWTSDPANFVQYKTLIEQRIGSGSSPELFQASYNALASQGKLSAISPEGCRVVEARAIERILHVEELRRQEDAFSEAIDNIPKYTPRYTSCTNYAGINNCVNY